MSLKSFMRKLKRETSKKLKSIRANNGGVQGPFETYCKVHGIRLKKTPFKTPQHNGVTKRMNRTIKERVWCMLSHPKLPKSFWGRQRGPLLI